MAQSGTALVEETFGTQTPLSEGPVANCWPGDGKDARQILPGQDVDEGEHGQVGDCLTFKAIMFSPGQRQAGTTVYPHFMLEVSRESVLRLKISNPSQATTEYTSIPLTTWRATIPQ